MKTSLEKRIKACAFSTLKPIEIEELTKFLEIYYEYELTELWMANEIITKAQKWDNFPNIRSVNTFNSSFRAKGIQPKFFAIASKVAQHNQHTPNTYVEQYVLY